MALPGKNRLRKKREFDLVFKEGNAVKGTFLLIRYRRTGLPCTRLGFIIPAKIYPSAVARNRVKRVLSETAMKLISNLSGGYDMAVYLKIKGSESELRSDLISLLIKKQWQK